MAQAKDGDKVRIHYTGRLTDGTVFDSSEGQEPLEFTLGAGNIIPGFETGTLGMTVGEKKTIQIAPEDAYGERRDELVAVVKLSEFPEGIDVEIGQIYQTEQPDGRAVDLRVTEINGEEVTLDANHPLAGETLVFEVELIALN
jgi:peptidylprolyl isomerase